MRAGASKISISPTKEMLPFPSPFGKEGDLSSSYGKIYRDIHVRTIAVDDGRHTALFVTFELASACCTERICKTVYEKYGIAREYISFSATHTHESVFASSQLLDGKPGRVNDMYEEYVFTQAMESIDQAISSLEPARFGFAKGNSYINACRDQQLLDGTWVQGRDFEGPSDKTLAVLKFVSTEGRLIAVLMNYGVHGTSCFLKKDEESTTMMVAGDVPGFVSDFVETYYADDRTIASWTIAAGGNQNPIFMTGVLKYDERGKDQGFFLTGYDGWALCEHLGKTQGIDVVRLVDGIKDEELKSNAFLTAVDRSITVPGIKRVGRGIAPDDPITIEDREPIELKLKVMTLNDICMLSINGELVAEIGLRIKEALPLKNVMIFSLSGESVGYLPDKRGYENRTFAFFGTQVKDGLTEEFITPAYLEMLDERFNAE